jgi:hypothetical protein
LIVESGTKTHKKTYKSCDLNWLKTPKQTTFIHHMYTKVINNIV